ncbi:MAG: hypothetical protein QUS33_06080 [Dehalococcoidia bacterium]|nr:hypothetical protein [Dehalococcoidia bacterium]
MAISRTYGKLIIPMIGDNEPVFILRGQDILAQSAIEMYRLLAEAHGCKVADALAGEINNFREWPGEKRLPAWPPPGMPDPKGRHERAPKMRGPWK